VRSTGGATVAATPSPADVAEAAEDEVDDDAMSSMSSPAFMLHYHGAQLS